MPQFENTLKRVLRLKIRRLALPQVFDKLPRCVVGMEACLSAHFVSRTLRRLGFPDDRTLSGPERQAGPCRPRHDPVATGTTGALSPTPET